MRFVVFFCFCFFYFNTGCTCIGRQRPGRLGGSTRLSSKLSFCCPSKNSPPTVLLEFDGEAQLRKEKDLENETKNKWFKLLIVLKRAQQPFFPSLPMDYPCIRLIGTVDVVLRQEAGQPCTQRTAKHPAFASGALLHRRHENKVSLQQLQLVIVLRHVRVHDLQCLRGARWLRAIKTAAISSARATTEERKHAC